MRTRYNELQKKEKEVMEQRRGEGIQNQHFIETDKMWDWVGNCEETELTPHDENIGST